MTTLTLDLRRGIDDHERPLPPKVSPLWMRVLPVPTQVGLLLYRDGTVVETTTWFDDRYLTADAHIAGGTVAQFDPADWQVAVLEAAGYILLSDDDVPFGVYGGAGYGQGGYGGVNP